MYIPIWILIIVFFMSGFGGFMLAAILSCGKNVIVILKDMWRVSPKVAAEENSMRKSNRYPEVLKLFGDYLKAKSRIKMIDSNEAWGTMNDEQFLERVRLRALITFINQLLYQINPTQRRIIYRYHIERKRLLDIAADLNIAYEWCSAMKNEALSELEQTITSPDFEAALSQRILDGYRKLQAGGVK